LWDPSAPQRSAQDDRREKAQDDKWWKAFRITMEGGTLKKIIIDILYYSLYNVKCILILKK
jgi:hypothetical protein